ncbi:P-loop containing nucleoside triphosphate hydrolase [Pseudocohnilembus persalinus]|uniref:small monomeric GTPase n=1 Tax=Pseudocohnilembus persalinus TaxID=266149 RepID=A0A0V0QAP4_PSEPJ|nr:P-loop containing nucleoside triphosphate hydrolase [Pseudocohnilembus persalinus]|eukprot:KRW99266.1 P-loop containing nucleoside triphosphate hydrolase [Pseudocohnilembus persalinus]
MEQLELQQNPSKKYIKVISPYQQDTICNEDIQKFEDFIKQVREKMNISIKYIINEKFKVIEDVNELKKQEIIYVLETQEQMEKLGNFQNAQQLNHYFKVLQAQNNKCKILFTGPCYAGKTSIIKRYIKNIYQQNYEQTYIEKYTKNAIYKGKTYNMEIIDTYGQYDSIEDELDQTDVICYVYSINDYKESLDQLIQLLEILNENFRQKSAAPILVLVGNKSDLGKQRQVSKNFMKQNAKELEGLFQEVSAKNNLNIEKLFTRILRNFQKRMKFLKSPNLLKFIEQYKKKNKNSNYINLNQNSVKSINSLKYDINSQIRQQKKLENRDQNNYQQILNIFPCLSVCKHQEIPKSNFSSSKKSQGQINNKNQKKYDSNDSNESYNSSNIQQRPTWDLSVQVPGHQEKISYLYSQQQHKSEEFENNQEIENENQSNVDINNNIEYNKLIERFEKRKNTNQQFQESNSYYLNQEKNKYNARNKQSYYQQQKFNQNSNLPSQSSSRALSELSGQSLNFQQQFIRDNQDIIIDKFFDSQYIQPDQMKNFSITILLKN